MNRQTNMLAMRSVLAVTGLLAQGGCAFGPSSLPLSLPPEVSGPSAQVVVMRKKQSCSSYPLTYLLVDELPIAALASGQYTSFSTSPGRHALTVRFHIIDAPLAVGGGAAAVPVGVRHGRYGTSASANFSAGKEHKFLITGHCFKLDENERFAIEEQSSWPVDAALDTYESVEPGPQKSKEHTKEEDSSAGGFMGAKK
jgi:hypothetical protein